MSKKRGEEHSPPLPHPGHVSRGTTSVWETLADHFENSPATTQKSSIAQTVHDSEGPPLRIAATRTIVIIDQNPGSGVPEFITHLLSALDFSAVLGKNDHATILALVEFPSGFSGVFPFVSLALSCYDASTKTGLGNSRKRPADL